MNEEAQAPSAVEMPASRGRLAWLHEGARVLAFRLPRWEGLDAKPATVAVLLLAGYLIAMVVPRVLLGGSVRFLWQGLLSGWMGTAVVAWLCWLAARSGAKAERADAVSTANLFAVLLGASLALGLGVGIVLLGLRAVLGPGSEWPTALSWTAWLAPLAWNWLAQLTLLCRVAGPGLPRLVLALFLFVPPLVSGWLAPVHFWWPEPPAVEEAEAEVAEIGLPLTDESIGQQARLFDAAMRAVSPPRRGRVNVYALTYAPNASEDVFMRESAVVARTMRERFGADGHLMELVANRATSDTLPWATPANLRGAIARMAAVMDRDRDVLFLHLTSHGGRDGRLANDTWPLKTEPVTPELLKRWLDEAGVRWRVVSVSACYSGSWIAPLAGDGTLVMTAADAEHTSYGCGKRSELTFFGRAMYEEALRKTWSFTEAHAWARRVIDTREKEAGKSDGYSNPQISEGSAIRPVLERLAEERRAR
ncbi:C13 family peptidase [Roseateles sp. NT4]|uniref:C13 family peptidase n=1 Tax=Roseateles sp. NT4 TaxID=3453715 RepID=UPI003EE8B2C0